LGGHSEKRTHRGGQQFPGMTITYALMEKVGPDWVRVLGVDAFLVLTPRTLRQDSRPCRGQGPPSEFEPSDALPPNCLYAGTLHSCALHSCTLPTPRHCRYPTCGRDMLTSNQLEDLAESTPDRVKILKKARVTKCIKEGDKVVGVEYEKDGKHVSCERPRMRLVEIVPLTRDPLVHRARHRHPRYRRICRRLHRRLAPQEVPSRVL
jgi:choline dehydrogenase-like flavoprotein